ncbi:MAG: OmpA family protein [Alphaproteobacteria bacterium]
MSHSFKLRAPRQVLACCLLAVMVVFAGKAGEAQTRPLIPDKPSVEVHLEVLRALKANAAVTSFSAPITQVTVVNKMPDAESSTYAPSGRKIPSEQPMLGQYDAGSGLSQGVPKNAPFARKSPSDRPSVKAASKPAPVKKSGPARAPASAISSAVKKTAPPSPTSISSPVAATSAADLKAEAALMKDLEKEAPSVKVTKAPVPLDTVSAAPAEKEVQAASPLPAPKPAPQPTPQLVPEKPAPDLPPLPAPDVALPVTPAVKEVKPVSPPPAPQAAPQPTPEIAVPDLPPLPVPDMQESPVIPVPPPVPKIVSPEILSPTAPLAAKPEAKKPAEVLVVKKDAGKELPPLPPLPLPSEAEVKEKPLLPSIEKRMDDLFIKQPKKQGVISDTTLRIDPSAKATEEANQKLAEEQKAKARKQESDRQAQLTAKEKKDAAPPASPLAALPSSTLPPPLPSAQIAPLPPAPELPESLPMAQAGDVDLPALPTLPPLTAITGDDQKKSSLEIVQPGDEVLSKDLVSSKPPAPMQPLDAEEKLPKVTSGAAAQPEMEGLPPILPPPPVAPMQVAQMEKRAVPTLPPTTKPPEAKPTTKPPEAKPSTTKPPEAKPEIAAASGAVSAVIVFDKDKTDLNEASKIRLGELALQIVKNNQQVRIVAYAAGTPEQASIARRISLSRALQIRAFLIDKGVNQLNINVQALGNKVSSGQPERADIFLK